MAEQRPLAVVTGASTGIGYELAVCCARDGFDLVIAADEPEIHDAARELKALGTSVDAVEADLATLSGVDVLCDRLQGRPVDALLANAGRGLGHAFLDQSFDEIRRVIETNVTGTVYLVHRVGQDMRRRNKGRILIVGSIAGFMPGAYQAVYNASKAFLDSFAYAIRNELKETELTVTCLMPGPTDTDFFDRADMQDTKVAQSGKDDPERVARLGFEAMMKGKGDVVTGWQNKLQTAISRIAPSDTAAEMHRKMAEPVSAKKA